MTPEEIALLPYRANVGIMLVNRHGLIFVAQRLDAPGPAWQMPQGGIDKGENPRAAALRELREETGIGGDDVVVAAQSADWLTYDLPADLVPKIWNGRWRGQRQRWFLMRFSGDDDLINIKTEHPEFSNWKWTDPSQLVANIVPFKREVYARVLAEFAGFLMSDPV